jgi:hypothetical protein
MQRTMRTLADGTSGVLEATAGLFQGFSEMTLLEKMEALSRVSYSYYTLEFTLFPFLFPKGRGFFLPGRHGFRTLTLYLRHRMHQMFSGFTLYKVFLLLMYQIQQCDRMARKVGQVMLSIHHVCWLGIVRCHRCLCFDMYLCSTPKWY